MTKPIRFTHHALEQCEERGTTVEEVQETIVSWERKEAKQQRIMATKNFQFDDVWTGNHYPN